MGRTVELHVAGVSYDRTRWSFEEKLVPGPAPDWGGWVFCGGVNAGIPGAAVAHEGLMDDRSSGHERNPGKWMRGIFCILLFMWGCASEPGEAPDAGSLDVGDVEPEDEEDVGEVGDAAEGSSQRECVSLEVEFHDGTAGTYQFVHTFDHRFWWWDAEERTTVALFDPQRFAEFPHDDSLRIVDLEEIESAQEVPGSGDELCYHDFLSERGLTLRRSPLEGEAQILMGNEGYHRHESGYGDFAWDFTVVDGAGSRFVEDGTEVEHYLVWDQPVYSPVSGTVVEVYSEGEDNPPGEVPDDGRDQNNMVGIHLGGGYHVYLLHFREGSIPPEVIPGAMVQEGQFLGTVGNSGVTLEPHLHVALLWWDGERYWSVPTFFDELRVRRFPGDAGEVRREVVPVTGEIVEDPAGGGQ